MIFAFLEMIPKEEPEAFFPKPIPPKSVPDSIRVRSLKYNEFKKIVESAKAKKKLEIKDKVNKLGETTQRVEEETRENRFGTVDGGDKVSSSKKSSPSTFEQFKGLWKLPKSVQDSEGKDSFSGTMDPLDPNISISTETLLNTDEYIYASFFNRIKREVGPRWEPRVQDYLRTTLVLIDGTYSTRCIFWLDKEGGVDRVELKESSGVKELDALAIEAIQDVSSFPNPPESLLTESGLHRVELGFLVSYTKKNFQVDYLPDPRFKGRRPFK